MPHQKTGCTRNPASPEQEESRRHMGAEVDDGWEPVTCLAGFYLLVTWEAAEKEELQV